MPDFGAPIAQNVDVSPNKGLQTLSDLMGLQQKQIGIQQAQQTLQTGQAIQQRAQAEAQGAQQAMATRQTVQRWSQNGQDDQGNSLYLPGTQEIDPGKFATSVMRLDPVNGPGIAQAAIQTNNDRVMLHSAMLGLTMKQREAVMGPMQAAALNPDQDHIDAANESLDGLVQQNPDMAPVAASAKRLLGMAAKNPDPKARAAMANTFSATYQPGQAVQTQPTAATQVTGPEIQAGITAAPAAGGGFTPTTKTATAPGPQIVMDLQGQPHYVGGAAGLGTSGPGATPFPTPQQVQTQSGTGKMMNDHFDALNASAGSLPLVTGLTKTIEGLAPEAFTGPGGDKKQYMVGLMRGLGLNFTGDAQTDTNLLNKAIAQLNISTPAGTDAARQLVEAGQPNSKMDPEAIKTAAGTIRGQVLMNQAERNFLQTTRLSNRGAGDPQAYQEGRQMFEASADPRIWQYEDLTRTNPKAADAFIAKQPDKADLVRKTRALISMGFFR